MIFRAFLHFQIRYAALPPTIQFIDANGGDETIGQRVHFFINLVEAVAITLLRGQQNDQHRDESCHYSWHSVQIVNSTGVMDSMV